MLSQRARYALRALCFLAGREDLRPAAIVDIAEASAAPRKFLEAILLDLKRHQILDGRQPRGLTLKALLRWDMPADWEAQRKVLEALR